MKECSTYLEIFQCDLVKLNTLDFTKTTNIKVFYTIIYYMYISHVHTNTQIYVKTVFKLVKKNNMRGYKQNGHITGT